jgi:hypothetical protein
MQRCFFLMLCLLLPNLRAQESAKTPASAPKTPYVERQEKEFKFYPGNKLDITMGVPGNLTIIGWRKGYVRMEAEKIVYYASYEEAKGLLQKSPIRVRYTQTSGSILTPPPPAPPAIMEMNLTLYVPGDRTDLNIRMGTGDLSIDSVNGWIDANVTEGNLEARSVAGTFSGVTKHGDIHVEMSGRQWQGLEFAASTDRGSVELLLPVEYSAAIQLQADGGKITVDYPNQEVDGESVPPDIVSGKKGQMLKAAVGSGGMPIKLLTRSGDVALLAKK